MNSHIRHVFQVGLVLILVVFVSGVVLADVTDIYEDFKERGSIAEQIRPGDNTTDPAEVLVNIESQVTNAVVTVRVIATIFSVVFIIWLGIIFFTSGGNPARLAAAKTQLILFFISLFCIFAAEPVVRFVLSWFV